MALVWGVIVYKIVNQMNKDENIANINFFKEKNGNSSLAKDSFTIKINYPYPFVELIGNELNSPETASSEDINTNGEAEYIEKPKISWPQIVFSGIIANKNKPKEYLTLIKLENIDILMKAGQELQGIKLLKSYPDSAVFLYKSETKTFYRNESK